MIGNLQRRWSAIYKSETHIIDRVIQPGPSSPEIRGGSSRESSDARVVGGRVGRDGAQGRCLAPGVGSVAVRQRTAAPRIYRIVQDHSFACQHGSDVELPPLSHVEATRGVLSTICLGMRSLGRMSRTSFRNIPHPHRPARLPRRHWSWLALRDSDLAHGDRLVLMLRIGSAPAVDRSGRGARVVAAQPLLAENHAFALRGLDGDFVPAPKPHPKRRRAMRPAEPARPDPAHVPEAFPLVNAAPRSLALFGPQPAALRAYLLHLSHRVHERDPAFDPGRLSDPGDHRRVPPGADRPPRPGDSRSRISRVPKSRSRRTLRAPGAHARRRRVRSGR